MRIYKLSKKLYNFRLIEEKDTNRTRGLRATLSYPFTFPLINSYWIIIDNFHLGGRTFGLKLKFPLHQDVPRIHPRYQLSLQPTCNYLPF